MILKGQSGGPRVSPSPPSSLSIIQNLRGISLRETAIPLSGTAGDPEGQVLTVVAEPVEMAV